MSEPMVTISLKEYNKLTREKERPEKLQTVIREKVLMAASAVINMADWEETPQGQDYWVTVHNNILDLLPEGDE